jgi:amidophosphoribosyltransferase
VAACQHDNAQIEEFDTSCFSGEYVTGDVTFEYLDRLQRARSDEARSRRRLVALGSEGDWRTTITYRIHPQADERACAYC